ncbi:hypothetical protein [Sulfurospirillum barnesii]|uniref:Ferrochelatase n=1 Tax=Sulfurospirillum barnesii (strain ATCC 700032 / DSM 10660 / SES-3) TaxID=760154 RepID=I3XVQ7_SULBS|nr:hypothetical protein [Sulfurospirillum barnesii]AFL68031.1 hypothetical protein Sulba_0726 [Sulfurospirillum barnesii SES-3]
MKIENFVRIIDGKLSTTPPIDAFGSICFEPSRVLHGDLFIDTTASRKMIHQALEKGAYAVVSILPFMNEDEECAWIEVSTIEQTLIKLLRYTITQKSLNLLLLSPVQESLLEMIQTTPKAVKRLKGDLVHITKTILLAKEEESFFLSNALLVDKIAPVAQRLETHLHVKPTLVSKGLFLSSFTYKERFYTEQKIPSIFVEAFLCLLDFCDENAIAYTLEHLNFCEHFYPQYISQNFSKKEFGTSEKVLIFEPTFELLPSLLNAIQKAHHNPSVALCLPESLHYNFPFEGDRLWYKEPSLLLNELKTRRFTYALIIGERELFDSLLFKNTTTQLSLF